MHCNLRISTVGGLGLALAITLGTTPASAADISDLAPQYGGAWHSTTDVANEGLAASLTISQTSSNGKFTGLFDNVPITGKVSTKGVITFQGKLAAEPGGSADAATISKGKAQLSATGQFIGGSFTYKGSGSLASRSGNYIFALSLPRGAAPANGADVGITSGPADLGDRYLGTAHNAIHPSTENLIFDVTVLTRAANGKITAILGATQITGKVSSSGKVTFKGKLAQSNGRFTGSGTGQLSATGKYFYGTIKAKASGIFAEQSGKSTFEGTVVAAPVKMSVGASGGGPAPVLGGAQ